MNDGLASVAVTVFLLDDRGAIAVWLVPLDHGLFLNPVAIIVMTAFADGYTSTDRADANADIIGKGWRNQRTGHSSGQYQFLHVILLMIE
jgi:hypothetical protein